MCHKFVPVVHLLLHLCAPFVQILSIVFQTPLCEFCSTIQSFSLCSLFVLELPLSILGRHIFPYLLLLKLESLALFQWCVYYRPTLISCFDWLGFFSVSLSRGCFNFASFLCGYLLRFLGWCVLYVLLGFCYKVRSPFIRFRPLSAQINPASWLWVLQSHWSCFILEIFTKWIFRKDFSDILTGIQNW